MVTTDDASSKASFTPPEVSEDDGAVDHDARIDAANGIIRKKVYWALGAGVLPLPVFDIVALTGVQLKLLKDLCEHYDQAFYEGAAKKIISTLVMSIGGIGLGVALGMSLSKVIPVIGSAVGAASAPIVAAAFTHALGRVFVMHLESGGTLLDFDAKAMREHFKAEFLAAKEVVSNISKDEIKAS